jgi:hypothetical protein
MCLGSGGRDGSPCSIAANKGPPIAHNGRRGAAEAATPGRVGRATTSHAPARSASKQGPRVSLCGAKPVQLKQAPRGSGGRLRAWAMRRHRQPGRCIRTGRLAPGPLAASRARVRTYAITTRTHSCCQSTTATLRFDTDPLFFFWPPPGSTSCHSRRCRPPRGPLPPPPEQGGSRAATCAHARPKPNHCAFANPHAFRGSSVCGRARRAAYPAVLPRLCAAIGTIPCSIYGVDSCTGCLRRPWSCKTADQLGPACPVHTAPCCYAESRLRPTLRHKH